MVSSYMHSTGKCLSIVSIIVSVTVLSVAEILISPQDTEAIIEETVKLHCKATSGNIEWHHLAMGELFPKLIYQEGFIYNGYKERFDAETTNDGKCNLIINGVKPADAGTFICLENSETPLQVAAELIVFERVPSNEFCAGKYTCKPSCEALELSCEMKSHGNYIPSMLWIESGGKSVDTTNNIVNGIVVSAFKLKSDPSKAVFYTCRIQYLKTQLESKYGWTFSTTERDLSTEKTLSSWNGGLIVGAVFGIVAVVAVPLAGYFVYRKKKIKWQTTAENCKKNAEETNLTSET